MAKASASDSIEETRSVPRSRKGVRTRARLVDAAKQVFERDGFLDARIVDIAETAGLAPGTFYHYFDSKEQIFREVAEAQEERLTAPPEDGDPEADADQSPLGRIRRSNLRYLQRYRDEAALMGVIEQVSRYDEHVNAARMTTMKHFVERAEKAVRQLQKDGLADTRLDPAHGRRRTRRHGRPLRRAVARAGLPRVRLRHGRRPAHDPLGQRPRPPGRRRSAPRPSRGPQGQRRSPRTSASGRPRRSPGRRARRTTPSRRRWRPRAPCPPPAAGCR